MTFLFIGLYLIPMIIRGEVTIDTNIDRWYIVFVIFLIFGFFNGLLQSQSKFHTFSDMTYFLGLGLYFPFKKHLKSEKFQKIIFSILIFICVFVLLRNFINYRQVILSANLEWKVQKARVAVNEIIILTGCILSLLGYAYTSKKIFKLFLFFIFSFFITGLILTQSRGYWITYVFAVFILLIFGDNRIRRNVIMANLVLGIIGFVTAYLFFNKIFNIVISTLASRWESITTVTSVSHMDTSLLERFYETETIIHKLMISPVTGYGTGVSYQRYYIIPGIYLPMTFIHNGYLAIWFKTGIMGLIAILGFCFTTLLKLWKIYRLTDFGLLNLISLACISLLTGMLIVNITSPQFFSFEGMTLIILIGVFASYYSTLLIPDKSNGHQLKDGA